MAPCGPWGAKGVLVNSVCVMLGPALPLQKGRFRAQDCRNRVDSWTLGDSWPCNGLKGLFLVGSEATLALTGGSGGVSGDRRTRMGHIYPLPGSMAPQGALCPKLTRLTEENSKKGPQISGVVKGLKALPRCREQKDSRRLGASKQGVQLSDRNQCCCSLRGSSEI